MGPADSGSTQLILLAWREFYAIALNKVWTMYKRMVFIGMALIVAVGVAIAEEEEQGWSGKGELGYVASRGNTDTETLNVAAEGVYNADKWRHTAGINVLKSSESDVDTADRTEIYGQSDYKLSPVSYLFGSLRYNDDEFSQFETQATLAFGYGRDLIQSETHDLKTELGIGYRMSEIRATGADEDEAIVRARLDYVWTLSESSSLTNELLIEAGSDNTFGRNVTALNTVITGNVGLKLGYEVRHNTDVDEPRENTDFLTTISLVYNF